MGIMAQEGGTRTERELIPAGLHRAVCGSVVDLGTHHDATWNKDKRECRLTFELSDVRTEYEKDGEVKDLPRLIGKPYTLSLDDRSNLRKDLQAWRNKAFTQVELQGFDIAKLVGVPCMVNVEHYERQGKTCAGIGSIVGLAQGMQAPQPEGDTYYYSIDDHGQTFPENMPEFIKKKIMASQEMSGAPQAPAAPPTAPPPFPAAPQPTAPPAPAGGSGQDAGASVEDEPPF